MSEVLVIDLRSLSYTGTTWLTLLIGSHPGVFALGAPQRAYQAVRGEVEPSELCRIHTTDCPFWPAAFAAGAFAGDNMYREVAAAASMGAIVVNNPFVDPQGVKDLDDEQVRVVTLAIVRDPRAVAWSYHKRHGVAAEQAAQWVVDHAYLAPVDDAVVLRYEDAAADPQATLLDVGARIGVDYSSDAVDYFRFPHHPVGGNPTPFAVVRRHLAAQPSEDPVVESRYQQAQHGSGAVTVVEGWRQFAPADLADVERIVEPVARRWGYR